METNGIITSQALIIEIMECWPPVIRLQLPDGQLKDFDTAVDLVVTKRGLVEKTNSLKINTKIQFTAEGMLLTKIDVIE